MIAVTIVAAAGSLILNRVHGISDYITRSQKQYRETSALLNQVALFTIEDIAAAKSQPIDDRTLVLTQETDGKVLATVENYAFAGVDLPVSLGYSPYQIYWVESRSGSRFPFLLPGLPPKRKSTTVP